MKQLAGKGRAMAEQHAGEYSPNLVEEIPPHSAHYRILCVSKKHCQNSVVTCCYCAFLHSQEASARLYFNMNTEL